RMSVQLRGKIVLSLVFGILVVAALSLVADVRQLAATLRGFAWGLAPAILGLTLCNYALRFLKWQYYLRLIGVRGLATRDSLGIFFSAFTMVMTPGKVGELLKSYLLRRVAGTPVAAGEQVVLMYSSANRDPAHFADPERLDLARQPNHHIAFGFGTHFCLGAALARLEIRVFLEELARRVRSFRLVPGTEVVEMPNAFVYGLRSAHVEFDVVA
ncbi:MAG TPA: cytochrome P450, partial [Acidimicrobiales bacterium]